MKYTIRAEINSTLRIFLHCSENYVTVGRGCQVSGIRQMEVISDSVMLNPVLQTTLRQDSH